MLILSSVSALRDWRDCWWESLASSVKRRLCKHFGKTLLSHQRLDTFLTRIEAVINSRPLTTVSDNVRDWTPKTPARLALELSLFNLRNIPDEILANERTRRQRYLYPLPEASDSQVLSLLNPWTGFVEGYQLIAITTVTILMLSSFKRIKTESVRKLTFFTF